MASRPPFIPAEQCVPPQCLPFPAHYPKMAGLMTHVEKGLWGHRLGPEELPLRPEAWAHLSPGPLQSVCLTVRDGANKLFAVSWRDGVWTKAPLPFEAGGVWADLKAVAS